MPVAFKAPSSPAPPPLALTGAPGPLSGPPAVGGSFDFLALLANMSALAATALPAGKEVPATGAVPMDLVPGEGAEPGLAELAEPEDRKADRDADDSATEDDGILAALGFVALAVPAPVAQAVATAASGESEGDAMLEVARSPEDRQSPDGPTLPPAAQSKGQDLLPTVIAAPTTPGDTLLIATDAPAADAKAISTDTDSSGVSANLHTLANHVQLSSDAGSGREIRAGLGTHAWTQQLGDEIAWLVQQGRDGASLKLSPEHLGPLEVRISTQDGGTSVWFGAAQAETRSALEQALPRLREMFTAHGLTLADAGVFKEAPKHQPRSGSLHANATSVEPSTESDSGTRATPIGIRLLDTYA